MFFEEFYDRPNCGRTICRKQTSYFVCPNCETPLCREEDLEELKDHYCHECGCKLDDDKEKALKFKNMSTTEAIEKLEPHFASLVPSEEPFLMRGTTNKGRAAAALKQLLWPGADIKKKFRLVIDYDPDFPIFKVLMFDLIPINKNEKEDSKIGS